ncbi:unnamed protein product [Effrenium voratum]|uniref:Uncharacterized protein n=1 Tax=Effrenium voratum TaxID=2562239 RepID=A0AA36NBH4_9DINO|nr:unnamed protein product [Effrenium voratum]CAJ1415708.1 unnamed protein product [Effrenium voratum]
MESEVRQFAPHERVSRCTLQSYLEGINFEQVAASMVAQVILALLGLDLGEASCEAPRFAALLARPPALTQQLDFATALWGSAGEPAAAVVQQHRRQSSPNSPRGKAS